VTRSNPGVSQFAHYPYLERPCANPKCGLVFLSQDPRQRYCTPECNRRHIQIRYNARLNARLNPSLGVD